MPIDEAKLNEFMGKMVGDMGAAMSAVLVVAGDRLGLYRALADIGPATSEELARRTGLAERNVREWLAANAASGYVDFDGATKRFSMSPEQTLVFAEEGSPVFVPGAYEIIASMFRDEPRIAETFKSGRGFGWHEHDHSLFRGTERFFRPGYAAHLVNEWIPALDGMAQKLERGASVADIGCGHGASTIVLAQAFPNSQFAGFDYHPASIERARAEAKKAGVDGRVRFEVASAKDFPGGKYDLIAYFDCLHDMGDPVGAAKHARHAVAPDGTVLLVEPFANDTLEENLNPVGRVFYSASAMICTPASMNQEVGLALGAQAGEGRLREVMREAGFSRFRRATETPFNLVLEARP
jgi:SAM-dependent methyltransferase